MEDFEYSVQISEHDWDCFIQECDECNLLPPSLAGMDDSGMSDIDDMGSIRAERVRKADVTPGFLEADSPTNGTPDYEGSPVDHYLSKYGVGGMENVLSGSEEDIHMESVNTFFERLRSLAEPEKLIELSQERVGKTCEAVQGEERCSDGPQASNGVLPKNIPKLNSLPARSETATDREAAQTSNANSNTNTMKKDEPDLKILRLVANNSHIETNKSTLIDLEVELVIREQDCEVTTASEVKKQSHSHEPPDQVLSSEMDKCKRLDDVKQGATLMNQTALNKYLNTESQSNLKLMAQDKLEKGKTLHVLLPDQDPKSPNKGASQERSPSASIKKKRRKKKRGSTESVESGHGYERQFLANHSDSEEEPYAWGRGVDPHSPEDNSVADKTETEKNDCSIVPLSTYSDIHRRTAISNLPIKVTPMGSKANPTSTLLSHGQHQNLPERLDLSESQVLANTLGSCKALDLPEYSRSTERSASPPGQTDDSVMSTPTDGVNVATNVQPSSTLHLQESTGLSKSPGLPVSITASANGKSDVGTAIENCDRASLSAFEREAVSAASLQQSNKVNHSLANRGCESEQNPKPCITEVISITNSILPRAESNYPALEASQNDKVSTTKSCLAIELGNTGRDCQTLCQRQAESPQQLEVDCHNTAQHSSTFEKTNFPLSTIVMIGSDTQELSANETKSQQIKPRPYLAHDENPTQEASANLTLDTSNSSPDEIYNSESSSFLDVDSTIQQIKYSQQVNTISMLDDCSQNCTVIGRASELNNTLTNNRQNNSKLSMSEDLLKSQSSITPNGSHSTLEGSQHCEALSNKEPVTSLSNTNTTNMLEKSCLSVSPSGQEEDIIKPRSCLAHDENPTQEASTNLTLDTSNSSPDEIYNSESSSFLDVDSKLNNTLTNNRQNNSKLSMSEDLLKSQSSITPNGSHSTLEGSQRCEALSNKEPVTSLSNTNTTNMLEKSCLSVSPSGQEEDIPQALVANEEGEGKSKPKRQDLSQDGSDLKCDLESRTEDPATTSKTENEVLERPDSKHTVYAMSSFWSEMEKLTIKDILGLRIVNNIATPSSLPPLPESDTAQTSDATDSGYFTQLDESTPDQSSDAMSSIPDFVESVPNCDAIMADESSNAMGVLWQSEPDPVSLGVGIYPENMMLTSGSDSPQPLLSSSSALKYLKKMSKNTSVRNLHALDSEPLSNTWKSQPLVISEEGELEKDHFTDGHMPRRDSGMDSVPSSSFTEDISTESYGISLTNIFQYVFGGTQSKPSPPDTDNIAANYIDGNSVPETYDCFFSDFDTGSFFYPLIEASDQPKDEPVPIFSYSRSTNRNLQFPEAYDHFFSSSSSDDSSAGSDEDDSEDCGPIRVVTRFSHKTNETQISTDIYDNFFTDGDLGQNLFWKNTFSLRNLRLTGSVSQKQTSDSLALVPVKQSSQRHIRTIQPINALGDQNMPFPDPLLYHLEERISRLTEQRFSYADLQTAVSNPRLDASLVPLRQTDMCLVCIAFASWVLKSANPQAGDAWKAVLLANVSALSAIGYLRKYVRVKAAAREKSPDHTSPR